jgi:hypothetical protein
MSKPKSIESLADLTAARPLKRWEREIKSLNGATVHFRELTAEGIDVFLELGQAGNTASFRRPEIVKLLGHTLCNSAGDLLVKAGKGESGLNTMPWDVVQELFQEAIACLGLGRAELDEKKAA